LTDNSYSLNIVDEFVLDGGQDFYLTVNVFDKDGGVIDLTNYTSTLLIAEFGNPTILLTTITGIMGTNSITYIIPESDSVDWTNKKYIYQPKITNTITSKTYKPKQGCFLVRQEIQ